MEKRVGRGGKIGMIGALGIEKGKDGRGCG